jgi:hypothetical protein
MMTLRVVHGLAACAAALLVARTHAAVDTVAVDWRAVDRQPLAILAAEASASLGDTYLPERVGDGDRHTKWVCPTRPSPQAPQWVAVTFAGGPQRVEGVAVFGERIDNDGVIDADIQVGETTGYRTVAEVRNATAPAWVVRFPPVPASKLRLLVLRSGGPTDHTDVYEIEVYGAPLTEAELAARMGHGFEALRRALAGAERDLEAVSGVPAVWRHRLDALARRSAQLEAEADQPAASNASARARIVREVEQGTLALSRWRARLAQSLAARPGSRELVERIKSEARDLIRHPPATNGAGGVRTVLATPELAWTLDGRTGQWSVAWHEGIEVAIAGAGFAAEIDGQDVAAGAGEVQVRPFADRLGSGRECVQRWVTNGVEVERDCRVYGQEGLITLGGRIRNGSPRDRNLGTVHLIRLDADGAWGVGAAWETPAAVHIQGHSLLRSTPFEPAERWGAARVREFRSSGILALVSREPRAALAIGYVQAAEASPDLAATFVLDEGGTGLTAPSRFMGRILGPGETLELNRLCLIADADPFRALERYGDALARASAQPVRTGPTALWCSWYAHRMGMTEEKVLANAAVAATHLKPLGLEFMQLDHGWQRGDITGDWVANERFPHGLRWLAGQLRERHGLRLGLWIAPTDVAETSELYRQHADWMLRGPDGKPRVNWRWYWVPNPSCYELDATHPDAYRFVADTFRRLTAEGVGYYKIDFIAAAGGEHFIPRDPRATPGWTPLRRAMEALREGAGPDAWIRYCQTPPVLSVGLANSVIGGDDTLDAGMPGRSDVLRDSALALAAGHWLNDRPYHREVCDMSVRMQGSIEEVRLRAALMTLAGCSVSWSDELSYLPPSRIRLMQQCMPPGNPPMRPLDLFDRAVPSVWHLRIARQFESWDVIGLFNFDPAPATRAVRFDALGLDPGTECAVFEFWEERFLGLRRGEVELTLPGMSSRILAIRRGTGRPQLLGTDLHVLQGWHEIKQLEWDARAGTLAGVYRRMPGVAGKAFFLVPEGYAPRFEFPLGPASARLTHVEGPLWMQEFAFAEPEHRWSIPFEVPKPPPPKEPNQ